MTPPPPPADPADVRQRHMQAQHDAAQRVALVVGSALLAAKTGKVEPNDLRPLLKRLLGDAILFARSLASIAVSTELTVTVRRPVVPADLGDDDALRGSAELGVDTILDDDADALADLLDDLDDEDWLDEQDVLEAELDDLDDELAAMLDETDGGEPQHSETSMRLQRLARHVSLDAGQRATREALIAHGVVYWTRETDGNACEACSALADGVPRQLDKIDMTTHPGCGCTLRPCTENGEPLDETFEPVGVLDLSDDAPVRTTYTGSGLHRVALDDLPSGFRVERRAPQTRPASEWRRPGDPRRRTQRKPPQ